MTVDNFLDMLCAPVPAAGVFNPWAAYSREDDIGPEAPDLRKAYLGAYLEARLKSARVLLIAEAPGYQGARFSGIAMTCERTLLGGKPGISPDLVFSGGPEKRRTSSNAACSRQSAAAYGYIEPTATYVWREIARRPRAAERVVLWNTHPFHPHKLGKPLSNRRPTQSEVDRHMNITEAMIALFPLATVVSVGEVASTNLGRAGVTTRSLRHPSFGGAREFIAGFGPILDQAGSPVWL